MKRTLIYLLVILGLAACGPRPTPVPPVSSATPTTANTATTQPSPTPEPTSTATVTPTPSPTKPAYPQEGRGPTGFESDVDPLTGLKVEDATLLERRPVLIKVENLPREHRPQYGLNSADIVYEYYTEQGSTRFAALYYGQNAEVVGPIRSGRFFDTNLVQMYKAVFAFGSAYSAVWEKFISSDFANRLIIENDNSCPALCRKGDNPDLLVANTSAMDDYLKKAGIDNTRQNLDGMFFQMDPPAGGQAADQVFVRFSGAIYNRWDWHADQQQYVRYAELANDVDRNNPQYGLLTDRNDDSPISADSLVTLCIPHRYFFKSDEIDVVEILPSPESGPVTSCDGNTYPGGSGPAWIARDGVIYKVTWKRNQATDLISLYGADDKPFAFKPGRTWFEVIGASSTVTQEGKDWKFDFHIAP